MTSIDFVNEIDFDEVEKLSRSLFKDWDKWDQEKEDVSHMRFELIDIEKRKNFRCYYCETDKSVKYKVRLFDDPTIEDINERYCCNKCILIFIDDLEELQNLSLSND